MSSSNIQLNDLFWTLQGEGRWTGRRALFVRLPFCNYDCPWCDTEFDSYKTWSLEEFREFAAQESARFAVITGGEPMAHKHLPIVVSELKNQGFEIACETNGSFPIPKEIDFVTLSPKAFTRGKHSKYFIHEENKKHFDELKYVVDEGFDFSILDRHEILAGKTYSLSPEYNQMAEQTKRIIEYIKEHPEWKLSLQTHKWIGID